MTRGSPTSTVDRSHWIDCVRGAALVIIGFDHIAQYLPALRTALSHSFQILGIVTMAEVFVLTSGATVALRYLWPPCPPIERKARLWNRAWRIYRVHLLSLGFLLLLSSLPGGRLTDLPLDVELQPLRSLALGALLLFQPRLVDLLPMYVLFFLILPGVFERIERGQAKYVFGASVVLWMLAQLSPAPLSLRYYHGLILPAFNPLAWQMLFLAGVFASHPQLAQAIGEMRTAKRWAFVAIVGALVLLFCLLRHSAPSIADPGSFWSARPRLGALRLLNTLLLLGGALLIAPSLRAIRPPATLTLLGRHSLYLWAFNIVTTMLWRHLFGYGYSGFSTTGQFLVCGITLFAMLPVAWLLDRKVAQREEQRER